MNEKAIVIYSGGLDSTTLLYHLRNAGYELKALSVNYGQRHLHRELLIFAREKTASGKPPGLSR